MREEYLLIRRITVTSVALTIFKVIYSVSIVHAATINVGPTRTYKTIQAGVNNVLSPGTVEVDAGTYRENIQVQRDGIKLQGAGADRTFINLSGIGGTGVSFENVTGCTLTGFSIRKGDIGVSSRRSRDTISSNVISGNGNGFENISSYPRVINNSFYANKKGVLSNHSSTLINNIFSNSERYGVAGKKGGYIAYNLFYNNTYGSYSGITTPAPSFMNITGNPVFVSPGSDFHLKAGSPAINSGSPALKDVFDNSTSDIGAYGGPSADTRPSTINGVTAASSATKVTVSWVKNLAYNVTDHRVYYSTSSSSFPSYISGGTTSSSIDITTTTLIPDTRYYFSVRAVADGVEGSDSAIIYGAIDNTPPSTPLNLGAAVGDGRLYLTWSASSDAGSGVSTYKIYYGTSTGNYTTVINAGNTTQYELSGLTNKVMYYMAVSAVDGAGNEGAKSSEATGMPEEIIGIKGLKDSGGCFIATAAYGSYEEKHVMILREFRDRFLLSDLLIGKVRISNVIGRFLVGMYYNISPPLAEAIMTHHWLKPPVRILLIPVILFSWLMTIYPAFTIILVSLILTYLSYRFWQRGFVRSIKIPLMALIFAALISSPSAASAADSGLTFGFGYGQISRADSKWENTYGEADTPEYKGYIGYKLTPNILAEFGFGYSEEEGKGKTVTGGDTGVNTIFQSAPVEVSLIFRAHFRESQIMVPYIGVGGDYLLYWERVKDGGKTKGGMMGYHVMGGLQILLDQIDPESASNLKEDYGINHSYLVLRYTGSVIDDLGNEDIDLGGKSWLAGFSFEF